QLRQRQNIVSGERGDEQRWQREDFQEGDKVVHAKFGEGLVLETGPKSVTVMFGSVGKKKLALDIAPLEKVK
ncbi:MAG: hypothetical protein LBU41_03255, partial [Clostridiales Family XIII bacterium]|nr:hypothetical protein [Clostridiales Family XIII bacterium]